MIIAAPIVEPVVPPVVRGACPALATPMMTGDGLLARVGLDGPITPADLVRIGELAKRHGNGLIDISARGNVQVRGLSADSAHALESDIRRLDLPLRDGIAVETGALTGLDPAEIADPEPLATAIRTFLDEHEVSERLAAKFAVVVDGGGQMPLHGLLADIRLMAVRSDCGPRWQILLGGTAATGRVVGLVSDADAVACVTSILSRIAAMDEPVRGRALDPGAVRGWVAAMLLDVTPRQAASPPPSTYGLLPLKNDIAAVRIGIPFGQCPAATLIALGERAKSDGITALRPAIDHSLVLFGREDACRAMLNLASSLILSAHDPRAKIATCPGRPSCRSGSLATHALGEAAARDADTLLDGSFTLHLSGCAKGCAHPATALVNLVGSDRGTALIFDGKTSDMPLDLIRHGEEARVLAALDHLVRLERGIGETTRDCLLRLGPARLLETLSQGLS